MDWDEYNARRDAMLARGIDPDADWRARRGLPVRTGAELDGLRRMRALGNGRSA